MSDEIRPSPEIIAIAQRWLLAYCASESEAVVNLFSTSDTLSYIGSADGEVWSGDNLRTGFGTFTDEIPKLVLQDFEAEAFESGKLGWAYASSTSSTPKPARRSSFAALSCFRWSRLSGRCFTSIIRTQSQI